MRDTSQDSLMIQQHGGLRVSRYDIPDLAEDDCGINLGVDSRVAKHGTDNVLEAVKTVTTQCNCSIELLRKH